MTTNETRLSDIQCPNCESDNIDFDFDSIDMLDTDDGYIRFECNECGKRYQIGIRIRGFPDDAEEC
jgi:predicted RNA-binding Zn-ribbon protein involved in translation (DUF1610 family)